MKSSALGGSGLPSTSESRLPSPPVLRGAYRSLRARRTAQWSGRHHHDNAFRLTVIEDSTALAQVSFLLLLGFRTRIQGCCVQVCLRRIYSSRGEPLKQAIILHANFFYFPQTSLVTHHQRTDSPWHARNVLFMIVARSRDPKSTGGELSRHRT